MAWSVIMSVHDAALISWLWNRLFGFSNNLNLHAIISTSLIFNLHWNSFCCITRNRITMLFLESVVCFWQVFSAKNLFHFPEPIKNSLTVSLWWHFSWLPFDFLSEINSVTGTFPSSAEAVRHERSQMQGGKNWILPKERYAKRFFWDSHWLQICKHHYVPLWDRMKGAWLWNFYSFNSFLFLFGQPC